LDIALGTFADKLAGCANRLNGSFQEKEEGREDLDWKQGITWRKGRDFLRTRESFLETILKNQIWKGTSTMRAGYKSKGVQ
jgi:hypothetical protein